MYSNTNICFLLYEYIWYSYSVKLTWWIYIRWIFGMGLLDIRHIFGIYSNIRHRISIIRKRIFIRCIFGIDSVDIRHIFGIYSNIRHRISIIRIWIFNFAAKNIYVIHIRSKSKLRIYSCSYLVQIFIFLLHCFIQ